MRDSHEKNHSLTVYVSIGLLLLLTFVVVIERLGIQAEETGTELEEVPASVVQNKKEPEELLKETLIIMDEPVAGQADVELMQVLDGLSVGYDTMATEEAATTGLPDLSEYRTVVLNTSQTEQLANSGALDEVMNWVEGGGRLWNARPNVNSAAFLNYPDAFGIEEMEAGPQEVWQFDLVTDFMIGSEGFSYELEDFETYGLNVSVTEDTVIHAVQEETETPLIWEKEYGQGRIVVNNMDIGGKSSRGIYEAQYSLLEDVFAYPVINSSVFFLDDFPAPFPEGWQEHITEHHDMDVETFFSTVWLPDMMQLEEKYGIPFTNVVVVTYQDKVAPPFDETVDKETFEFYGKLMNMSGGEIGFHGYNHQPLVLDGFRYSEDLGYNTWHSTEDIAASLEALIATTNEAFPEENPSVYVPPSNILSEEAREVMANQFEEIKTIASLYVVTGTAYEQEFDVGEDGIVNLPRTVSGLEFSEYNRWMVLNELNFHYVNSHFFHPDDLMDEDRGADKGWTYLKGTFEEYLQWLDDHAPGLRKQKASDGAKAVQRYDAATFQRTSSENGYEISIDNFYDEMYGIVRIREGTVQSVDGGKLTPLTSELYLLEATQDTITIQFDE
ncbi:DUF2194 domain-containing protein [Atopococcus tabaci]|uniref:DUF2194 domain-containing protein n=1 Tax=Atopococcus tabaci TaxID=269774 RepID=UPI00040F0C99|nr:DUF2194 domain-containing protein [Atopococcus tabaci]